jgi:hypothetical protein
VDLGYAAVLGVTVWRNYFSSFVGILDIIPAISDVFAAAMAGRSFADG